LQATEKVIFITATEDDNGKPEIEYHVARSSGSNNNSMPQMSKADSTDRDSAFILDIEKSSSNGSSINNNGNNYLFAITGKSFNVVRDHYPDVMERLTARGAIFARMSPDQKETLVAGLQELGYYVAMCGDG
jgi:cation-transporting ATPase 13A3/4/5